MKDGTRQEFEEWQQAVALLVKFDQGAGHLDSLLDQVPRLPLRWLVMQAFRDWPAIEGILHPRLGRPPRPVTRNLLRLGVAECLCREAGERPKIVHHVVEVARSLKLSKAECGFVNAVLRTILRKGDLDSVTLEDTHPTWLRERWERQFGAAEARKFMEWNQAVPAFHVTAERQPSYAEASEWAGFYKVLPSRFREALADLEAGQVYLQDPFTRIPVDLLDPVPGESVMDLCAAPGGKSRLIARRLKGTGRLVLVDQPGPRLERLKENVSRFGSVAPQVIGSRIESLASIAHSLQLEAASMDAVLIDVPCSNTGVIQKRPDVKIRLTEKGIKEQAVQQLGLLHKAAEWVRPGGRLVYSTCSLENEENEAVVETFCQENPAFKRRTSKMSLPWECGHDGGGAFLLTMAGGR